MTQQEHDTFYGFTPNMTPEERFERQKQITRIAKWNNDLDEDTPDSVAMDARYADERSDTHLEEYDLANDR